MNGGVARDWAISTILGCSAEELLRATSQCAERENASQLVCIAFLLRMAANAAGQSLCADPVKAEAAEHAASDALALLTPPRVLLRRYLDSRNGRESNAPPSLAQLSLWVLCHHCMPGCEETQALNDAVEKEAPQESADVDALEDPMVDAMERSNLALEVRCEVRSCFYWCVH